MKKLLSLICFLFFLSGMAIAQENATPQPEELTEKSKSSDKFMFTLTFDNLFHKETNGFQSRWHSRGTSLHFMYDMPIKNSNFSFAPGIGFSHSSYYHNSFVTEDSSGTDFAPIDNFKDNENFKRHKLTTNYVEIPVEMRWISKANKRDNHWKVALGMRIGLKLMATSKEVRNENGYFKKIKTKGYRDVNVLRAGPTLRVGYGALNLYGFYSLTGLFKKDLGPEMTPFSIGLAFTVL